MCSEHASPEIEVTPGMIAAGAAILDYDTIQDLWDGGARVTRCSVVEQIFDAMLRAASSTP